MNNSELIACQRWVYWAQKQPVSGSELIWKFFPYFFQILHYAPENLTLSWRRPLSYNFVLQMEYVCDITSTKIEIILKGWKAWFT